MSNSNKAIALNYLQKKLNDSDKESSDRVMKAIANLMKLDNFIIFVNDRIQKKNSAIKLNGWEITHHLVKRVKSENQNDNMTKLQARKYLEITTGQISNEKHDSYCESYTEFRDDTIDSWILLHEKELLDSRDAQKIIKIINTRFSYIDTLYARSLGVFQSVDGFEILINKFFDPKTVGENTGIIRLEALVSIEKYMTTKIVSDTRIIEALCHTLTVYNAYTNTSLTPHEQARKILKEKFGIDSI